MAFGGHHQRELFAVGSHQYGAGHSRSRRNYDEIQQQDYWPQQGSSRHSPDWFGPPKAVDVVNNANWHPGAFAASQLSPPLKRPAPISGREGDQQQLQQRQQQPLHNAIADQQSVECRLSANQQCATSDQAQCQLRPLGNTENGITIDFAQQKQQQSQRLRLSLGGPEDGQEVPADNGGGSQLIVLKQVNTISGQPSSFFPSISPPHPMSFLCFKPEEQHRARYASEGSRGAIKDRSGTSYCTIQLVGYYRPTRVELYAGERCDNVLSDKPEFVQHSLYRLIPVVGKSSAMTPCKCVTAEDGTERLEIVLRPENQMIGVLDCIGIMKICLYGTGSNSKDKQQQPKRRKRKTTALGQQHEEAFGEKRQQQQQQSSENNVHIVARAYVPSKEDRDKEQSAEERFEVIQAVTDPIRCVQQLGTPDVLKMSLESSPSSGGTELFIIGRNFDPKDTNVLFREYKNDGTLFWSAEAAIDRRFLHQCHIVCTVPAYHTPYRNASVSVTVVCGTKQSHPRNFAYIASGHEDDDWRPPDDFFSNSGGGTFSAVHQRQCPSVVHPRQYQQHSPTCLQPTPALAIAPQIDFQQ